MQAVPIENIDPSIPSIFVRRLASTISDNALLELRLLTECQGNVSDCLRDWLRGNIDAEVSRRHNMQDHIEPAPWALPWHGWDDNQLRCALVTSFSWYDQGHDDDTKAVIREVLRATVTACGARLGELHAAIQASRSRK